MRRLGLFLASIALSSACVTIPQQRRVDPVWSGAKQNSLTQIETSRTMAKDKMAELEAGNAAMPAAVKAKPKKAMLDGRYSAVKKQFEEAEKSHKELVDWATAKDSGKGDILDADTSKLMSQSQELGMRFGKLYSDINSLSVEYNALASF